jgi:hypothetical protein
MTETQKYKRLVFKMKFIHSFNFLGESGPEMFDCKTDKKYKKTEIKTIFGLN